MIQIKIQSLYQSYYYCLQIKLNKERSLPMNSQYFFTKFIKTDLLMVLFENNHIVFTVKQYDVVIRDQPAKNNYHHEEKVLQIRHIHDSDVRENKVCIELKNVSTLTLKFEDMKNIAHRSVFVNIQELFQMMRDDQYPQIEKFYDFVRVIFQYKCKHTQMPTYFQVELKYVPTDEKNQNQEPQILEGQTEMKNEEPMQDIKKKKKKQSMIDEREEDPGRINEIKTEIKGIKNKINSLANNMKESKINLQNRLNQVVYKSQQKFNVLDKRLANHLNICHMNRQIYYSPIITVEKTIKLIKNNYIFSQFFMNPNIKLKSQKLIMCNSKDNSLKIAMIQPPLFIDPNYKQPYYYKISLKVVKIGAYVGVGIRDNEFAKNISFKQYRQNSQTDQSLYILDYHGDIWSHYQVDEGQENPKNAFQFQANDVIEIKFIPDISKVTFKLRSDQSRFSLKVNPRLNFNFSFCVYLQGQGDEVQIIENIERNLHAARKHSYPFQIKKQMK